MICPRCGGEHVDVNLITEAQGSTIKTETKWKKNEKFGGHGCLWWILVGWWWWMIDFVFWIVAFPIRLFIHLLSGKKKTTRGKSRTTREEVIHTAYRAMCLCHDCGYHWEEEPKMPQKAVDKSRKK